MIIRVFYILVNFYYIKKIAKNEKYKKIIYLIFF